MGSFGGRSDGFPIYVGMDDTYSDRFRSKETWQILRGSLPTWECHRGIWFPFATSKFAFLSWLAAKNRLATGEKMECWNINVRIGCSFCAEPKETREHLFFDCPYSRQIWEALVGGLMGSQFTWEWTILILTGFDRRKHGKSYVVLSRLGNVIEVFGFLLLLQSSLFCLGSQQKIGLPQVRKWSVGI
ncbi:alcohol dehydrogenase superfamily protein [Tanacetum coccineum]